MKSARLLTLPGLKPWAAVMPMILMTSWTKSKSSLSRNEY
jgi:hypothetical protein